MLSAVLLGLAGAPHCLAMCGAACTAAAGGSAWRQWLPLHLGRLIGYAAAGGLAAASVGSLAALGQAVAALRPLWTLVHIGALGLGLYLLWQGRQPAWLAGLGRRRGSAAEPQGTGARWQAIRGPVRRTGLGLAWVAWPCGLLQSALLVAALANSPAAGAAVMAGFALASAAGLLLGPALWWRLVAGPGQRVRPTGAGAASGRHAVRWAGAALALASAWALSHGLWLRVAAWCLA